MRNSALFLLVLFTSFTSYAESLRPDTLTKALHFYDKGQTFSDKKLVNIFLTDPDSPYSELKNDSDWILNDISWMSASSDFQRYYKTDASDQELYQAFTREAGFTKSRPELFDESELKPSGVHGAFNPRENLAVRASVVKAQIDPDIFYKALDIFFYEDERYSKNVHTLISKFAVAAQIIRDKSQSIAREDWAKNGLEVDVLDRFMNSYTLRSISPSDREYLLFVLNASLRTYSKPYDDNKKFLPTQYRLARLSSALVDRYSYLFDFPCTSDHRYKGVENTNKQCFVDMTDRGLWQWYVEEYKKAIVPKPHHQYEQRNFLSRLLEIVMPIALIMDGLAAVDFFTSSSAAEFAADGLWEEEEVLASQESFLSEICSVDL
ncbi:hypothetical protein [Vibrio caribbeanicus]|uniref:hypothetical protein n=1 Tax=Vibrio caribbeanicus TaxID=701175 RepID=UPI0030D99DCA